MKNRHHFAKMVENARINCSVSLYCILLFSRKENFKFFEVALPDVLCNGGRDWLHDECVRISVLKYCQDQTGHLLVFQRTAIEALNKGVKFVQTSCKFAAYFQNSFL